MTQLDPSILRKTLRKRRQQLSESQQESHAQQACQHLIDASLLNNSKRIALFLSQDGELDTQSLIKQLWKIPTLEVYLPTLETQPNWHMGFARYTPQTQLIPNKFNIPEPAVPQKEHLSGEMMDMVIVPLVGFDKAGNRMGMGGGYYDRTFEFKRLKAHLKPLLIGWAHSCQQVDQLKNQPWDVPLNVMVTENGVLYWN